MEPSSQSVGPPRVAQDSLTRWLVDGRRELGLDARRVAGRLRAAMFGVASAPVRVGRYELGRRIGAGGMGDVYEAFDPELQRAVAIKLLRGAARLDAARMLAEGRALASLQHPHVAQVFEVGTVDDGAAARPWCAMELVDGAPLDVWLALHARSWRDVVAILLGPARALAAAHALGLVHRDVKPSNIIVGHDGRARVVDFGLATFDLVARATVRYSHASPSVSNDERAGTPTYAAPEVVSGASAGAPSDQYGFCVTMAEALSGRAHPDRLARVLARGLASDPSARWPDMRALIDELEATLARRPRRVTASSVGALAVIAVGIVLALPEPRDHVAAATCEPTGALAGVWDESDARFAVHTAFANAGIADDVWPVDRRLGEWRHRWTQQAANVCELRSDALARKECLDTERREIRALVQTLASGGPDVLVRSPSLIAGIDALPDCMAIDLDQPARFGADPAVQAAVGEVRDDLALAGKLEEAGRYDDALDVALRADAGAVALGLRGLQAEARWMLGRIEEERGDVGGAIAHLSDAYWTAAAEGDERLALSAAANLVYVTGVLANDPDEAQRWERQARAAFQRGQTNPVALAQLELNLGAVALDRGDPEAALSHYREGMALRSEQFGLDHPWLGDAINDYGAALFRVGRIAEAGEQFERAIVIWTKVYPAAHPRIAMSLRNLCIVAMQQGELARAEEYCTRETEMHRKVLGPDHPDLAGTIATVASLRAKQTRWTEADALMEEAARIYERTRGVDHPDTAMTYGNRANMHLERGKPDQALEMAERSLASYESALGPDHEELGLPLHVIGEAHLAMDRPAKALPALRRALTITRPDGPRAEQLRAAIARAERASR